MTLYDMHCHMGFVNDVQTLAKQAASKNIEAFSATVKPDEFERLQTALAPWPQFRVGLGLHPWWIADGNITESDVEQFEELAFQAPFISEIGLDFAHNRTESHTETEQKDIFERILQACAQGTNRKVISLHAVHATTVVLDNLARFDIPDNHLCIFHRFSGSREELTRATTMECFFSINPHMLQTKRGRMCVQAIPEDRLLLETDSPAQEGASWDGIIWQKELEGTLSALATVRQQNSEELAEHIARNSKAVL